MQLERVKGLGKLSADKSVTSLKSLQEELLKN